jgi:hypothetical protein
MKDMKRDKIIYNITTGLLSLSLATAGFAYLTNHSLAEAFRHYGFPGYFRIELGIAKIIGACVLILPTVPARIKGWTYTGILIVFVSACIAHWSVDGFEATLEPLFALCLWSISVFFFRRTHGGALTARKIIK